MLFGIGEEVPIQQPLQEHSISMKMLQELESISWSMGTAQAGFALYQEP